MVVGVAQEIPLQAWQEMAARVVAAHLLFLFLQIVQVGLGIALLQLHHKATMAAMDLVRLPLTVAVEGVVH